MKIVHIIFSLKTGGSETMLIDIINKQAKDKHNLIELLIINNVYDTDLINSVSNRVKIVRFNRPSNSYNPIFILRLNAYIKKSHPDVLHLHNNNIPSLLFCNKIKTILTVHDMNLDVRHLKQVNIICAISNAVRKDITDRARLDAILVYNGIDFDKIKAKVYHADTQQKVFKMVQVSRLDHLKKGQDILIKAVGILREKNPDISVTVDFIGEGRSITYLQTLVQELGLSEQINFLGLKDHHYIYAHLCDYNLLVQPSIYEGFGLTVVEGIAAKIPVLTSNNDGPMEIIKDGEFGFYFEKGNPEDCAKRIDQIIQAKDLKGITDVAYTHAKKNFNISATAQKYLRLYSK